MERSDAATGPAACPDVPPGTDRQAEIGPEASTPTGGLLDAFAAMLCVVDDHRRVHFLNAAGHDCINRRDGFVLRGGRLDCLGSEATDRLDRALREVRAANASQDAFLVETGYPAGPLWVVVSPLAGAPASGPDAPGLALIVASRPRGGAHDGAAAPHALTEPLMPVSGTALGGGHAAMTSAWTHATAA